VLWLPAIGAAGEKGKGMILAGPKLSKR